METSKGYGSMLMRMRMLQKDTDKTNKGRDKRHEGRDKRNKGRDKRHKGRDDTNTSPKSGVWARTDADADAAFGRAEHRALQPLHTEQRVLTRYSVSTPRVLTATTPLSLVPT